MQDKSQNKERKEVYSGPSTEGPIASQITEQGKKGSLFSTQHGWTERGTNHRTRKERESIQDSGPKV